PRGFLNRNSTPRRCCGLFVGHRRTDDIRARFGYYGCIWGSSDRSHDAAGSRDCPASYWRDPHSKAVREIPDEDLFFKSAGELASLIRTKTDSASEVMASHLERINRVTPILNAIVAKLDDEQCLSLARDADERQASGEPLGPLHGLPIAFKDLQPAV